MTWDAITGLGQGVLGFAAALYATLWFIRWLCEFIAKRQDVRQNTIDAAQHRLDDSVAHRLAHLESIERQNHQEIRALREAVEILAGELRIRDPGNAKLLEVAGLLRHAYRPNLEDNLPLDMQSDLGKMP